MKKANIIIESCVENLEQAVYAESKGADQIELCAHLELGGTSPSVELVQAALKELTIPVKCMIRPRGGNFVYTQEEFDQILVTLETYISIGVSEIVVGMLTENNSIELDQLQWFLKKAKGLKVTFHKAIDETTDIIKSAEQLVQLGGIHSILTSGGEATAWEGRDVLKKLNGVFGDRVKIIAAGSITRQNLNKHVNYIAANAYHGRKII